MKPFFEALVTEQDLNAQIGAALCLAKAIEMSDDPEPMQLRKLVPRMEKLLRSESFRAKSALLTLIGSVIEAGGARNVNLVRNLVSCLVEFLSSDDWAARKAAAEALIKLGMVERDALSEFKASCMKTFEAKRFDKVKVVRETMNQMMEVWKEIPDLSGEVSSPPKSQSCSKGTEDGSDVPYGAPQLKRKPVLADRSPFPDGSAATARRRSLLDSNGKKTGPALFRKLDRKKPSDWKVEIAAPNVTSRAVVGEVDPGCGEKTFEKGDKEGNRSTKQETRRTLFSKDSDGRMHKFGGFKAGSRVVPCNDERSESTVVTSNVPEDISRNHKECEDLSLIRGQLVQIETQQSNLLDLLQGFIGSSQNGMRSLEKRVHGLELALDEISYDLAVSTGRMSNPDSAAICCKLPGAEFLSSKLFGRTEGRFSTSRFSFSGTPSVAAMRNTVGSHGNTETFKPENRRFWRGGGGGFVVNPLAEMNSESQEISVISSKRSHFDYNFAKASHRLAFQDTPSSFMASCHHGSG
ncbi:unnamed protein product [Ilex paraguariensis]|uniref:TORTIFOLIA1/SINE1-2 N-terminal domain-containing protein n=1 Tax=Ilex paraguariensis TaxID=185542 RepID=A0ABC8TQD0_9AQUA